MRSDGPTELVIMSWAGGWGQALRAAVCEPFTAETGIAVRQAFHVGLQLPAALTDALAATQPPPFDVVWSNSVPALWAEAAGYACPLDDVAGLQELSPRAHAGGVPGRPLVFPYVVYYVLVYRAAAVARPPESWSVLLEDEHRGRIALYPRGNGLLPIAQRMGGGALADIPEHMEPAWSFVRRLAPQVGELDYSIGMERLLSEERLNLCFRALPNALAFQAAGLDVRWCVPSERTTDTLDALWVPAGLPDDRAFWGRRLLEFSLRPAVQERFCELLGCMPVHPHARPPSILTEHPLLPSDPDDVQSVLYIPEEMKFRHDAAWAERFAHEIGELQPARSAAGGSNSKRPPARQIS